MENSTVAVSGIRNLAISIGASVEVTGKVSVRRARYERERNHEDLGTKIIADVQDPLTAILCAVCRDERPHNCCSVVARCNQVVHSCAALINQYPSVTGTMEIDVGHISPPRLHFSKVREFLSTSWPAARPRLHGRFRVSDKTQRGFSISLADVSMMLISGVLPGLTIGQPRDHARCSCGLPTEAHSFSWMIMLRGMGATLHGRRLMVR